MTIMDIQSPGITGGRVSSPKFRASLQIAEKFSGLEENVSRFHALKLIKQAGRDMGFTAELIELLEYYVVRTNDIDWTAGHRPIFYQAVVTTARELDMSERQVRRREKALNELGALTWNDSGNFKRYGMRDKSTGAIIYAHGVDLSPLATLIPVLEQKIEQKKAYIALVEQEKRNISALRGRIRALLSEAVHYEELDDIVHDMQTAYEKISFTIRAHHDLDRVQTLLADHQFIADALLSAIERVFQAVQSEAIHDEMTALEDIDVPHIHSTTPKLSDKSDYSSSTSISLREGVAALSATTDQDRANGTSSDDVEPKTLKTGIENIEVRMIVNASSSRFRDRLIMPGHPPGWSDIVNAAFDLLHDLKINKTAWWEATKVMGVNSAAVCVMIIDQKAQDPAIDLRTAGGYLRAMTKRAQSGELNLHGSVFGLLKKDGEQHDA